MVSNALAVCMEKPTLYVGDLYLARLTRLSAKMDGRESQRVKEVAKHG